MKCENILCVHNQNDFCILKEISIGFLGFCTKQIECPIKYEEFISTILKKNSL